MKKAFVVSAFCGAHLLAGCGGSDFTGASAKQPTVEPKSETPSPQTQDQTRTEVSGDRVVQTFIAEAMKPVDIVMALDTSTSMVEEKASLEQNLELFVSELSNARIDSQVTIITKLSALADPHQYGLPVFKLPNVANVKAVDAYVHSNDAIGHLTKYYKGGYEYPLPLRDKALLEAVIITDDNGTEAAGPYGVTGNMAKDFSGPSGRSVTVNAIVGLNVTTPAPGTPGPGNGTKPCAPTAVGTEGMTLAQQTGGAVIDICTPNWSDLVKQLSANIAARSNSYILSKEPKADMELVVYVDGVVVDPKNYTIDYKARALRFASSFPVKTGSEVKVEYYFAE